MGTLLQKRILRLFTFLLSRSIAHGLLQEPGCNQFSFQEQVLEKLIVLDHTVKTSLQNFEDKITQLQLEYKQDQEALDDFRKRLEDDLKTLKKNMEQRMVGMEKNQIDMREDVDSFKSTLQGDTFRAMEAINETLLNQIETIKQSVVYEPVLFTARLTSDLDPTEDAIIVFGTEIQNIGGAYDYNTGIFTAPINGTYLFSVQMCINKQNIVSYAVMANEKRLSTAEHGDAIDDVCSSTTALGLLTAGDKVSVKCVDKELNTDSNVLEANSPKYYWTMFTGVLIHTT